VPVPTVTAERSFSTLRRLKTYLHSTMSQPRLNHIVLLHSLKVRTDALDLVHIAKTFVSVNNRRQELKNFWMCLYSRILELVEQVQMRAAWIFLGVGRLHARVSLQFEMQMVPLRFEAKKRCIEFWVKVLNGRQQVG